LGQEGNIILYNLFFFLLSIYFVQFCTQFETITLSHLIIIY